MSEAGTSILLLDDDPDVGLAAQLLLRRVAPVICLRRPAELYGSLERCRPAVLLLDLNFGPGRTDGAQGLRIIDEVRVRAHAPVIVVMTAYAEVELAVQALRRGAFDFITKPWNNVRLVSTCREALQRAHGGRVAMPAPMDDARPSLQPLATQERVAVLAALSASQGNLSAAARTLGLSRAALYRRLQKHGL